MISSDPPTVEDSSSTIPLVDEDFQLNPSGISTDASGPQEIKMTSRQMKDAVGKSQYAIT